jgi:hypothetical protein
MAERTSVTLNSSRGRRYANGMKWYGLTVVLTAAAIISPSLSGTSTSGTNSHHGPNGYFCTSNGYLAYDLVEEHGTENAVISHSLKIVRVGGERGVYYAEQFTLPNAFGVLQMKCLNDHVELGGLIVRYPVETHVYEPTKCVVRITGSEVNAGIAECSDDPNRSLAVLGEPQSLSIFGPDAPISIESPDPNHRYQLLRHVSYAADEWSSSSEIVQLDLQGTVLKRLAIYDYRSPLIVPD